MRRLCKQIATALLIVFYLPICFADTLLVAVASNFRPAMKSLVDEFHKQSTHRVKLSYASSGKHYAQIINGAPFDVFFSAGSYRPELLEQAKLIKPSSRFTYAIGRLALVSVDSKYAQLSASSIYQNEVKRVAIANPRLAPYGFAAQQVLNSQQTDSEKKSPQIITAENVAQALQFVVSKSVDIGLVAFSQAKQLPSEAAVSLIPNELHDAIEQQAVVLTDSDAATEFVRFVKSDKGAEVIKRIGYDLPRKD